MVRFLKKIRNASLRPAHSRRRSGARRLPFEQLEDRCVLNAVAPGLVLDMPENPRNVSFMSQNLDQGADLTPIIGALQSGDQTAVALAVGNVWEQVHELKFSSRAAVIADEISNRQPTFVGLQEVSLYTAGSRYFPWETPSPGTTETIDYLGIILDALESRGMHYSVATTIDDYTAASPGIVDWSMIGGSPVPVLQDISLVDHDVILVRSDLPDSLLKVTNVQQQKFPKEDCLTIPLGEGQEFTIWRGWNAADVLVCGQQFRLIETHLEDYNPAIPYTGLLQMAEANAILNGPANTTMPVVMIGDFNSRADGLGTQTYSMLISTGMFTDAWSTLHPGDSGYTWGDNPTLRGTPLDPADDPQRIDLVLYRGDLQGRSMTTFINSVPADPASTTPDTDPLWASDHAGVAATIALHVAPNGRELPWVVVNDDPARAGEKALFVMGTSGDDFLSINGHCNGNLAVTSMLCHNLGVFHLTAGGHLYVYGGPGNDSLILSNHVFNNAVIYGGLGNDVILGGSGNNILLGGKGNDWLSAWGGRNVLIGGDGNDCLLGTGKGNILIGGTTVYDNNEAALDAILAEWASYKPIDARIAHILAGVGSSGSYRLLKGDTVQDDGARDWLFGGPMDDWFFALGNDRITGRSWRDRMA
jgi:endonuclease/exonuclease/phosphatase family metal-dependent hydrolase